MKNIWRVVFGLVVVGGVFGGKIERVGAQAYGANLMYIDSTKCAGITVAKKPTCTETSARICCESDTATCSREKNNFAYCLEDVMLNNELTVPCTYQGTNFCARSKNDYGIAATVFNNKIEDYTQCLLDYFNVGTAVGEYKLAGEVHNAIDLVQECLKSTALDSAGTGTGATGTTTTTPDVRDWLVNGGSSSFGTGDIKESASNLCSRLKVEKQKTACNNCVTLGGWWTALGCMNSNINGLSSQLVVFLLGLAGLFLLAQILIGAFKLVTATGDPRAAQEARERITSAVIALLFIIFSVTILRVIGIDILSIPGFFNGS